MVPRHPIPNMTVKRYSGEDTKGEVLWENSTMPRFSLINFYFQDKPQLAIQAI